MARLRKHISFLAILLVPVYLLVLGSTIRNRHSHVLPNGLVITHSHPFTDSNGEPVKHSHTSNQVLFYQLFTFDFFQSSPEVVVSADDSPVQREINAIYAEQLSSRTVATSFLRGPPAA
jgi:hypothetical protein